MPDRSEQKKLIIDIYSNNISNKSYREIADLINDKFDSDYWDSERVRDVIRKDKKHQYRKNVETIPLPEKEYPQAFSLQKKKIMVTGDWHFPYHREDLLEVITKHKNEIDAFVVGGDAINKIHLS